MSTTILDALQNAEYNIKNSSSLFSLELGKNQLHNAIVLLKKGYDIYFEMDEILEKYDNVELVPDN
jgi:hypothetical protein